MDKEAIIKAVREYNAAENSLGRAHAELAAVIPPGVTVLHKVEGSDSLYWSYGWSEEGQLTESVENHEVANCIIIEAPKRKSEFLPRLEQS